MIISLRYCLFMCLFFIGNFVLAGTTGKLVGKLENKAKGEPLIGANVVIMGTDLGAATDLNGNYYILQINV